MGRVLNSTQVTGGQVFPFSYTYNLAGGLSAETYPSGRTVTMGYDNANRPNLAQGSLAGQTTNYVSSVGYWPNGGPQTMAYGNGLTRSFTFNARNQPTQIMGATSAGTLLQLNLGWEGGTSSTHDIGRLRSQQISAAGVSFTQSYVYDPLKRLQSITDTAAGTTLQRSFNYDPYGNNWLSQNDNGLPYNSLTPVTASSYGANNRITLPTAGYDQMGNQTVSGGFLYSYDSENRVYLANDTVAPVGFLAMFYDGLGQRIQKQLSSGAITTYVYDAFGQLADEYSNFSVPSSCSTCYLSTDHLGSTRLVTDGGGNVMTRHDFMPFGDEITGMGRSSVWGASADGVTQKFTGQQRDEGQGLDFFNARYFYSALGRFSSPDPMSAGADPAEPQTWNGYAYVANDPMSEVDPDGLGACSGGQGTCTSGAVSGGSQSPASLGISPYFGFQFGGGPVWGALSTVSDPSVQLGPSQGYSTPLALDPNFMIDYGAWYLRKYGHPKPKGECLVATCHTYDGLFQPLHTDLILPDVLVPSLLAGMIPSPVATRRGSGPAAGVLEVSDAYTSSKAVQNYSGSGAEFVFDTQSRRFVMGNMKHRTLVDKSGIGENPGVVGGMIAPSNGGLTTNERSGTYGLRWNDPIRQIFIDFLAKHGVDVTHSSGF